MEAAKQTYKRETGKTFTEFLLANRPPRIAIILLVITTGEWYFSPTGTFFHMPYNILGALIAATGFVMMLLAWLQFKSNNTAVCPTAETTQIVKKGMYAFSRNPMYLGLLLMLTGASFVLGRITSIMAPVLFFLIIDKIFIPFEEQKLATSFGDTYKSYMKATRRWV